jgi:hypothetical protein
MNCDVLSRISEFCDIDSRRTLGGTPQPLQRNIEFDKKLQDIHGLRKVYYDLYWFEKQQLEKWTIILNDSFQILVDEYGWTDKLIDVWYGYYNYNNSTYDSCNFGNYRNIDGGRIPQNTEEVIEMRTRLDFEGSTWVDACFLNGKWVVTSPRHRTFQLTTELQKLGFNTKN